jgi:hypothetical protein
MKQLKFIDSLHKITGYVTSEGKFVPNSVLKIGGGIWFFGCGTCEGGNICQRILRGTG